MYVLSESNGWSNVLSDGTVGYVLSRYLDEGGSSQGGSSSGGSSTGGGSGTAGTVVATGVTTTSVNLRASASIESASLAVIPSNTTVGIIAQSGNFYKVSYNGAVGYVQKTYLGNIKQSTGGGSSSTQTELEKGRVTASSLNVRASASSSGTLLDRLEYGTIVEIVAKRGDFYQIKYGRRRGLRQRRLRRDRERRFHQGNHRLGQLPFRPRHGLRIARHPPGRHAGGGACRKRQLGAGALRQPHRLRLYQLPQMTPSTP